MGSPRAAVGSLAFVLASPLSTAAETLAALPLARLGLITAALLAVGVLLGVSRPSETWYRTLSRRLLYGVPWGTLVVVAGLLAVYYGLQGGYVDPDAPVVLPFRAWSYFDPTGLLVSSFAHASLGHLTGNLLATLTFGSLAEYVWGHRVDAPTDGRERDGLAERRGRDALARRVGGLLSRPLVRIALFPVAVLAVGIVASLLTLGPVIGFSTVVFAFAGFALVRSPLATVLAGVAAGGLGTILAALRVPQEVFVAEVSYNTPWFASTAIQAHAVGLFVGVLLGIALLRHRGEQPPPAAHLWSGVLLFGLSRSLWAVYWYRGNDSYVLYRAVGVALVFVLVALVTYAVLAADRPVFAERRVASPETVRTALAGITYREVGLLLLVCAGAVVVGPGVALNLSTADDAALPGDPIEIRGYEVTYGEDVPDGQLRAVDVEAAGETTRLNTSGVIVRHTERHIWTTPISRGALADRGEVTLQLGGVGWRERVTVSREGWQPVGGEATYRVVLDGDGQRRVAYTAPTAEAEALLAGARVSITPTNRGFDVAVDNGDRVATEALPAANESVAVGGLEISNDDGRLVARVDETAVRIATRE